MAVARGVRHVFLDTACKSWGVFLGMQVTAQTVSWCGPRAVLGVEVTAQTVSWRRARRNAGQVRGENVRKVRRFWAGKRFSGSDEWRVRTDTDWASRERE
jgi:hypothetical protein